MRRLKKLKLAISNQIGIEVASVVVVVTPMETVIGESGEQKTRRRVLIKGGRGAIVDEVMEIIVEFGRILGISLPCISPQFDSYHVHTNDEHVVACPLFKALRVMKNHLHRPLNTSVSGKMMSRNRPVLPRKSMSRKGSVVAIHFHLYYLFFVVYHHGKAIVGKSKDRHLVQKNFFSLVCILTESQSLQMA